MAESGVSDVVISTSGRDKDRIFLVIKAESEYLYLADGRLRKAEKPKKKKRKHSKLLAEGAGRTADKLRAGERVQNSEIRKVLADFRKQSLEKQAVTEE